MTRRMPQVHAQSDDSSSSRHASQILPVPTSTNSYWRTERHPLDEYKSPFYLPFADIVIIGAGMSGVVLAYQLLKECGDGPVPSIVILEARQGHAKVMTMSQLRMRRAYGSEFADEMAQFFDDQNYALKNIVETEQIECEFEMRRSLDILLDEDEARSAEEDFRDALNNQESWTKLVDFIPKRRADQVTSVKGVQCAFSDPACSFWPYKFVTGLLAKIIDRVNLQTNTPVTEVRSINSTTHWVMTSPQPIVAKKVVFATNAYTAGICPKYAGKIVPYKGTNSHLKPHKGPVFPHVNQTYNIAYGPGRVDYLNPRPDGGITVGGGKWNYVDDRASWWNNWDDSTLLPNVEAHFDGLMQRYFKGWEESESYLHMLWTGIMGQTADDLPHVGKVVGQQTQYIMAGFNGGGMSMIVLIAQGLAKMIIHDISFAETGLPKGMESTAERLRHSPDG